MTWRPFIICTSVLTAVMSTACVNAPTHPAGLGIPAANSPDIFSSYDDDTTRTLDCISGEIRASGANDEARKTRIALGPLPNTVGPKAGRVDLPPSLQPFARAALDRISSGIALIDESTWPNVPAAYGPQGAVPHPNQPLSQNAVDIVQLRLNGSIYLATPFRVLENELQAFGFGIGTHVEATDIKIQMYWQARVSNLTFQQSGSSVSMTVRLYSAEQGASAFRVTSSSNGLVMARSRAAQEATPHLAIQSAVNIAVAMLMKDRLARNWGVASTCTFSKADIAFPPEGSEPPTQQVSVRLVLGNGELCAVVRPSALQSGKTIKQAVSPSPLELEVVESRGGGIEIRRRSVRVPALDVILASQRPACFPRGAFDVRTEQVDFFFKLPGGRTLGSGTFFF